MPNLSSNRSLPALACIPWDLLIVGGGITGAGIFFEASRRGLRALLVEQNDFGSGTSSRSSKLVHGGLHYLKRLQVGLAHDSVRSRELMVDTMGGLVNRLDFLLPTFTDDRMPPSWQISFLLSAYDLLAGRVRFHRRMRPESAVVGKSSFTPLLSGAHTFSEATTDDARLVLHVLRHGCERGGHALNYVSATELVRDDDGCVVGARLVDRESGSTAEIRARAVINATGPWADRLRTALGERPQVRLIRGSHLVFPPGKLPIGRAIATLHPATGGPIYFIPWQGVTLVGSTSIEQSDLAEGEPAITAQEARYLLDCVNELFPALHVERADIQATFAGVRPIIGSGITDPAQESREDAIWSEQGLLTVTGGKLTTFLTTADKVMKKLRDRLPMGKPVGDALAGEGKADVPLNLPLNAATARSSLARYGIDGLAALVDAAPHERACLPGLRIRRAELRWIARAEAVHHLDDLLLRRLRIGLTAQVGGVGALNHLRPIVQSETGWSDARWDTEVDRYKDIWMTSYSVPNF